MKGKSADCSDDWGEWKLDKSTELWLISPAQPSPTSPAPPSPHPQGLASERGSRWEPGDLFMSFSCAPSGAEQSTAATNSTTASSPRLNSQQTDRDEYFHCELLPSCRQRRGGGGGVLGVGGGVGGGVGDGGSVRRRKRDRGRDTVVGSICAERDRG